MNNKKIVKISNLVGMTSIVLLIYWVFAFIIITVFGLKIFRENLTTFFYLSVIGILSLMFGALMLNIMFNLTNISEHFETGGSPVKAPHSHRTTVLIIASFPLIVGLLFVGDWYSSQKKEAYLISSAKQLIHDNPDKMTKFAEYQFDSNFIKRSLEMLTCLQKLDENFPAITVINKDTIGRDITYLQIEQGTDYSTMHKTQFIFTCSKEEKEYLNMVFGNGMLIPRFEAVKGTYELYYPVKTGNRVFVLYFREYSRYGGSGS